MRKLIFLSFAFFIANSLLAQADLTKFGTDIKKLYGEYLGGFRNLKGALRTENNIEAIFNSRMKLTGTTDSSNYILYNKEKETWSYGATFNDERITTSTLDSVLLSLNFPFGKLKLATPGETWGKGYTPDNKKNGADKLRSFFLQLAENPLHKLSIQLGGNSDYWYK